MKKLGIIIFLFYLLAIGQHLMEACQTVEQRFKFPNSDVYVRLERSSKLKYTIMKGSSTLQTVIFDNFQTTENFVATPKNSYVIRSSSGELIEFELIFDSGDMTHIRVARDNVISGAQPRDCIDLDVSHMHWYGGSQDRHQYWPIERQMFSNFSYLTKEDHNAGIAERYWLNSLGVFIYVDENTPLFLDQNSPGHENQICFSATNALPYNQRTPKQSFIYHIGIGSDPKSAHMYAVKKFLGIPTDYPDERMVQHPIWSTWAIYKSAIDDAIVRDFGQKIIENGFENSQLEIDDDWETCYGSLTFNQNKFPNVKRLTDDLKAQNFRVTLWIHPFINVDCTATFNEAKTKGYLVLDHKGQPETQWWNSNAKSAAYIDFTKPDAAQWFVDRLKRLQTVEGIDNFKFDAGESSWVPSDPVLNGPLSFHPNQITRDYIKTVAQFGSMVEVRSGQGTQNLPIFVRMIDKDSRWNWTNGLITLVTTLLQLNMVGYPFVLPDMIGGNGYDNQPPSKELFLRWLQANVFMPSLQFSYVPWNFDREAIEISKKFTKLHSDYTPYIMKRFRLAVETGEPVNLPLWWIDSKDDVALGIYDEFLLGTDIIAAPILTENQYERDIYLPVGEWQDGNTLKIHKGPIWLMEYPAPLDTLPYFIRVGFQMN